MNIQGHGQEEATDLFVGLECTHLFVASKFREDDEFCMTG